MPGLFAAGQRNLLGAGQVGLGMMVIAVGLLLLLSETQAGGQLAQGTKRVAGKAVKAAARAAAQAAVAAAK